MDACRDEKIRQMLRKVSDWSFLTQPMPSYATETQMSESSRETLAQAAARAIDDLRELAAYFNFKEIGEPIGLPCRATAHRLREAASILAALQQAQATAPAWQLELSTRLHAKATELANAQTWGIATLCDESVAVMREAAEALAACSRCGGDTGDPEHAR